MTTTDRLVEDYLDRLEDELADLPRAKRRELVDEIEAHIAEGRTHGDSEAQVRTLLDRLGEPSEIADEARDRFGIAPRGSARGARGAGGKSPQIGLIAGKVAFSRGFC